MAAALYVFGLAKTAMVRAWDGGIYAEDTPLMLHAFGEISAITATVNIEDFSGPSAEEKFKDTEWLTARLLQHNDIIVQAMRHSPLLPMPFATLFVSPETLEQQIARNSDCILEYFKKVDKCQEWAVKILLVRDKAYEYLYHKNLLAIADMMQELPPGARYLKEKQLQSLTKSEVLVFIEASCQDIVQKLNDYAIEGRKRAISSDADYDGKELIVNLAFLLDDDDVAAFIQQVQHVDASSSSYGLHLTLSGPWPTYSFCPRLA